MTELNLMTMDVMEAVEKSDKCPLCFLWTKSEERHMQNLLTNEVTMDPEFREKVLASRGFCNHHMHLLYKTAYETRSEDGLGYALYMRGVIEKTTEQISALSSDLQSKIADITVRNRIVRLRKLRKALRIFGNEIKHIVQGQQPCPACEHLWSMDEIHIHTLIQMLAASDFRRKFRSSKGICLSHFASAIQRINQIKVARPTDATRNLLEIEMDHLKLLESYLAEFIRKQSWEFKDEPRGPEIKANIMALNLLAGAEDLYCNSYKGLSPWQTKSTPSKTEAEET